VKLNSTIRGIALATGGALIMAGVVLANGANGRERDDNPSPSATIPELITFGASASADVDALVDDTSTASPEASFDDDGDEDEDASPSAEALASFDDHGGVDDNSGPGSADDDGDEADDNSGPGSADDDGDEADESPDPSPSDDSGDDGSGHGSDD
jgi:hypothetical protein